MKKFEKIWRLKDPAPNLWYEISCYLKTTLGLTLIIFGLFLILPYVFIKVPTFGWRTISWKENVFCQNFIYLSLISGTLFIILGLYVLTRIKLIKDLIKILKSS